MPSNAPGPLSYAAPPEETAALEACRFYHSMELPGLGLQPGQWDLRAGFDDYFGGHDFTGERVLDIGTANGALAFEIERRGAAEVVAFDLADGVTYDCRLPTTEAVLAEARTGIAEIKSAFWLAHSLLRSEVKVVYGHAVALPEGLGQFDSIVIGNVLQHLQDPVGAVLQAVRHTDHLLITEADWLPGVVQDDFVGLLMFDLPNPFSWYQVKPGLLQNLLGRWDFDDQRLSWHTQVCIEDQEFAEDGTVSRMRRELPTRHYTLSARRGS